MSTAPLYTEAAGASAKPHDAVLSGWWRRVGATLLDVLIVYVPVFIVASLLLGDSAAGAGVMILLGALALVIYAPLMLARSGQNNGQTLGKQALGIRAVRGNGEAMTLGSAAMREVLGKTVLGFVPLYGLVDSLFPLFDGDNQAIHDKLASTYVVQA